MLKHFKKYLFFFAILFLFLTASQTVFALEQTYPPILGITLDDNSTLADFVAYFFSLAVALAGVLGVLSIVIAGIILMASAGNPGAAGAAKERIFGSILGIILLMFSVTLLSTINSQLVNPGQQQLTKNTPKLPLLVNGGFNYVVAPPSQNDTSQIQEGYNTLYYNCDFGPKLMVWKYSGKNLNDNNNVLVEFLTCGQSTSLLGTESYKWAYQKPGIYVGMGPCVNNVPTGNITERINDTGNLPDAFKQKATSALFVNGEGNNEPRYYAVFNEGPDLKATCSEPIGNPNAGELCLPILIKGSCGGGGGGGNFAGAPTGWPSQIFSSERLGIFGIANADTHDQPVCVASSNGNECFDDVECGGGTCDPGTNTCIGDYGNGTTCTSDTDCVGTNTGFCDAETDQCIANPDCDPSFEDCGVSCDLSNGGSDCGDAGFCDPNDNQCVTDGSISDGTSCTEAGDCSGAGFCDPDTNQCLTDSTCDPSFEDCGISCNINNANNDCSPAGFCDPDTDQCLTDSTCDPESEDCGISCYVISGVDSCSNAGFCNETTNTCDTSSTCDPETEECGSGCDSDSDCGGSTGYCACVYGEAGCGGEASGEPPQGFGSYPVGFGGVPPSMTCISYTGTNPPVGSIPCATVTDCGGSGTKCEGGQCVDGESGDVCDIRVCGGGQGTKCEGGQCVVGEPNDFCDAACGGGPGTVCQSGQCVPGTGAACEPDVCDGGPGTVCQAGQCVPGTGTPCDPDVCDGGAGTICQNQQCVPGQGAPCDAQSCGGGVTNGGCTEDRQCVSGTGGPSCTVDGQCSQGNQGHCVFSGEAGSCIPGLVVGGGTPCTNQAACINTTGSSCNSNNQCAPGNNNGGIACTNSNQCGYSCDGTACTYGNTGGACNPINQDGDCQNSFYSACFPGGCGWAQNQGGGVNQCTMGATPETFVQECQAVLCPGGVVTGNICCLPDPPKGQGDGCFNMITGEAANVGAFNYQSSPLSLFLRITPYQKSSPSDEKNKDKATLKQTIKNKVAAANNITPTLPTISLASLINTKLALGLGTGLGGGIRGSGCVPDCGRGFTCVSGTCQPDDGSEETDDPAPDPNCPEFLATSIYVIKALNIESELSNNSAFAGDGVSIYEDGGPAEDNEPRKGGYRFYGPVSVNLNRSMIGSHFTYSSPDSVLSFGGYDPLLIPGFSIDENSAGEDTCGSLSADVNGGDSDFCDDEGFCSDGTECAGTGDAACGPDGTCSDEGFCTNDEDTACSDDDICNDYSDNNNTSVDAEYYPCASTIDPRGSFLTILYSQNEDAKNADPKNHVCTFLTRKVDDIVDLDILTNNKRIFRMDIFPVIP